ncbi:MAG: hypothetical protein CVU61_09950 [Deltaproteobacteria bacterium HGW-Deltaproteobacteria-19]|jgi:hypothetical protein|nr:MAG: hypothetical protein CVU61_09950 [Deltaproteobacteria bacterium HGW-Deltaproteobacteria-19]
MKHRVIQCATGSMGRTCLRAVIDHPDLELVGLYVYSDRKAGRDAGEIARRNPTGGDRNLFCSLRRIEDDFPGVTNSPGCAKKRPEHGGTDKKENHGGSL